MINAGALSATAAAGMGYCAWGAFHPRSELFGSTVCSVENGCALNFDDGPNPKVTPRLLALLEKHKVSATFFVLGKYARENPQLTAEIAAAGHVIGNHTESHPNLVFSSRKRILDELKRCEEAIVQATGRHSRCVRPPFGFRGPGFASAAPEA